MLRCHLKQRSAGGHGGYWISTRSLTAFKTLRLQTGDLQHLYATILITLAVVNNVIFYSNDLRFIIRDTTS